MIRDKIIYENKMSFLQIKCYSCSSKDHIAEYCPLIHFAPDKEKIVKQYIRDPGHIDRRNILRSRKHKFNSRNSLQYIQDCNNRFRRYSRYFIDNDDLPPNMNDFYELTPGLNTVDKFMESNENAFLEQRKLKINTKVDKMVLSQKVYENFDNDPKNVLSQPIIESTIFEEENNGPESLILNVPKFIAEDERQNEDSKKFIAAPPSAELRSSLVKFDFDLQRKITDSEILFDKKIKDSSPYLSDHNSGNNNIKRFNKLNRNQSSVCLIEKEKPSIQNLLNTQNSKSFHEITDKEVPKNTDDGFNDIFLKEFEKGADFKNYNPSCNLQQIMDIQKRQRQKKTLTIALKKGTISPLQTLKRIKAKIMKINKIVPENENQQKSLNSEGIDSSLKKIKRGSRPSNIFTVRSETKFFGQSKSQKMSFYDVVREVLYNQELRKKLQSMRIKSISLKKKRNAMVFY